MITSQETASLGQENENENRVEALVKTIVF